MADLTKLVGKTVQEATVPRGTNCVVLFFTDGTKLMVFVSAGDVRDHLKTRVFEPKAPSVGSSETPV